MGSSSWHLLLPALAAYSAVVIAVAIARTKGVTSTLAWVFAIDLGTFAVSLACLAILKPVPPPPAPDRPSLRSVVDGLRYARSRPELLGTYRTLSELGYNVVWTFFWIAVGYLVITGAISALFNLLERRWGIAR